MSTQKNLLRPDFRERAKANDVPVARLIGFEAKDIGNGQATVTLSAGLNHANPMGTLHSGILCDIADAPTVMAFAGTLARGILHDGAKNRSLSAGLKGATSCSSRHCLWTS